LPLVKDINVNEAFELLLAELETALQAARSKASEASQAGRYTEAKASLTVAQRIEQFVSDIRAKQREWKSLPGSSRPQPAARGRMPKGSRTPEDAFFLPILRALDALGGEAKVSKILDLVFAEMKPHLKPIDIQPVPSDRNTPRWRNTAQWARLNLVQQGLLRNDSPNGIWAISEKGRKYLAERRR
jgi:hypothetical protein